MFFRIVVLLSLTWPLVVESADLRSTDQVVVASKSVAQSGQRVVEKDVRDQLMTSIIDTTVHYENSNDHLSMEPSSSKPPDLLDNSELLSNITLTNSLQDNDNSSVASIEEEDESLEQEAEGIDEDPAYSTEARLFLNFAQLRNNRRSFEYQSGQNGFELLKVKNDTPIVANYPNSYEDPPSSSENGNAQSPRHRDKGKTMDGYTGNYGISIPANHNAGPSYGDYYSYDSGKDKKLSHEQEKVGGSYHQQGVFSYDSHGHTVNPTTPSLPRTTQEANNHVKGTSKDYDGSYDSVAMSTQVARNHKFTRPVVVAEPNYHQSNLGSEDFQTSRVSDSGSSEVLQRYSMNSRNGRFRSDEDSRDASDESDYMEYSDRPRRLQKSRRKPSSFDSSRKLPKEHRGSIDDSLEYDSQSKRHHSRGKSHRQRVKGNSWVNSDHDQEDSYEETKYDGRYSGTESRPKPQHSSKFKPSTGWKQVSPNLEISHSSGVEVGQVEKPKYIVPVNLVPVANFDHATAIGSSQGFDMSNVLLPVSTPTPESVDQDSKYRVSTPVPDVIVGQNNFQNTMQAILPQTHDQNKYSTNLKPQYVTSTISPIYAVTPTVGPDMQSIPIQDVQGSTPRPSYINQLQPMQGNIPQLIVPQPTIQTLPTLVQTPNFNIQVNPNGMHGQNLINGNLQVQSIPAVSTVTPVTKINLVTAESQSKRTLMPGSTANFLASASLAVGQNVPRQLTGNSFYLQSSNSQQVVKPQVQNEMYQQVAPKTKAYIQTTHLVPAVLHPMPTLATFAASTPHVIPESYVKIPASGYDSASTLKSIKVPPVGYQTVDSVGSQSTATINTLSPFPSVLGQADNAHLPYVGMRNVEIVNPNIKPSPVNTAVVNAYETMHYPAAVLTTPIPMFTTTSVVTTRPLMSSTSETPSDMKAYQSQEKPMFNPINFVPNMDVMKNQNALNSKLHANEPLQQGLNLVPLIPGGNFFKPSFSSQNELLVKPKLTSDLETYAEQMFKESLKTIYNSQKWNNDRKPGYYRQNVSDTLDLSRLRNELQRLKASLSDSKRNKDQVESHSETKLQTAEFPSKKPDELIAALEQVLKTHPSDSMYYHGNSRPHKHRRPGDQDKFKFSASNDFRDTKNVRDHMKHPSSGPYRSKGHFHEKPGKKRPISGPTRYNRNHFHGPRSHPRHHALSHKSSGLEASATNFDPIHSDTFQFEGLQDSRHRPYSDSKKSAPFDSYPSLTTSVPNKKGFPKGFKDFKEQNINHPRMHNFLGLLMKNKQLPARGDAPNYFTDKDQLKQFFEEDKQRTHQQFYDDTFNNYFYKTPEGTSYSNLGHVAPDARRSLTEIRGV